MFQLVQNLKKLKHPLKGLHQARYKGIHQKVDDVREELLDIQKEMQIYPLSNELFEKERATTRRLQQVIKDSHSMKLQQSKQEWLTEGDKGSKIFFAWIKKRRLQNQLLNISTDKGEIIEGTERIAKMDTIVASSRTSGMWKPDVDSPNLAQWERCDNMVFSWILHSIQPDLAEAFLYASSSAELWKELEERFRQSNGPLKSDLSTGEEDC
ncbi:unnamed protein product [Cuscuta campestris]|uniref:Retrotransposon gag domain-containing protein n=1 Tax=Cuscuta campestris TaxID=132261 RepID=A0A484LB60_9ASTE|nr:unnamed protein product [Cuscuta campestris]